MSSVLASLAPRKPVEDARAALMAGDPESAIRLLRPLTQADPADYEIRYWLYSALVAVGDPQAAQQMIEEARTLHAVAEIRGLGADMAAFHSDREYCLRLGRPLYASKLMACASVALGRGLDFERLDGQALVSYGLSLQHQGRMEEAIAVFSAATDAFNNASVHEFLLYALFHAPDRLCRASDAPCRGRAAPRHQRAAAHRLRRSELHA